MYILEVKLNSDYYIFDVFSIFSGSAWPFIVILFEPRIHLLFFLESLFGWHELVKTAAKVFVYIKHCAVIVKLVTIIGSTEYSYKLLSGKEFKAIFHNLVPTNYQIKVMLFLELLDNPVTKHIRNSALVITPLFRDDI